jgi:dTDP-4-amino-4,6-dideoxygalactose transaminase
MDPLMEIAQEFDLAVIEDNAHGLFGEYKGRLTGTLV